jgi:hypothetical protein
MSHEITALENEIKEYQLQVWELPHESCTALADMDIDMDIDMMSSLKPSSSDCRMIQRMENFKA